MVSRLKTTEASKFQAGAGAFAVGEGPHAPAGTRGWHAVDSAGGSTTLWRRRGRIAPIRPRRRDDR